VENAVLLVERWILARLRHHTFFSLRELNAAIAELLTELNTKPFKQLPGCRKELFEQLDRPAMHALPAVRYTYAEWKRARVHIDYHVEVLGHYYSVPYQLVRQELDVRITANIVELHHRNQRVASHPRSFLKGRHTTLTAHMPTAHQQYAGWTPQRLVAWAHKTGPATAGLIATILGSRAHPQQGFRSCLGVMRLGKSYGAERLEAACQRALQLNAASFKSLQSILQHGLDRQPLPAEQDTSNEPITHPNIRGAGYYH
jgi:transposase